MAESSHTKKSVAFEPEKMVIEDSFEELTKPIYKGKRIDEAIPTAVVNPFTLPLLEIKLTVRTNGSFFLHFLKLKDLLSNISTRTTISWMSS